MRALQDEVRSHTRSGPKSANWTPMASLISPQACCIFLSSHTYKLKRIVDERKMLGIECAQAEAIGPCY